MGLEWESKKHSGENWKLGEKKEEKNWNHEEAKNLRNWNEITWNLVLMVGTL